VPLRKRRRYDRGIREWRRGTGPAKGPSQAAAEALQEDGDAAGHAHAPTAADCSVSGRRVDRDQHTADGKSHSAGGHNQLRAVHRKRGHVCSDSHVHVPHVCGI